jgi:hypothetical protein
MRLVEKYKKEQNEPPSNYYVKAIYSIYIMSFICDKCGFIFSRKLYLERHLIRKIACDRKLVCVRCSKEFKKKCNLVKHMTKKNPCIDMETLRLLLKIEEVKLKQEIEKTKQSQTITITSNTLTINNFIDIANFDQAKFIQPGSQHAAELLIKSGNVEETLRLIAMNQYTGGKRYIRIDGEKIYIKINDEIVEFKHGRYMFNNRIKETCEHILYEYGKYLKGEMIQYNCEQRRNHILDAESITIERTRKYVGNNRNNGYVDKVLINTFNDTSLLVK